ESLRRHDIALCKRFLDAIVNLDGVTLYGPRDVEQRVGVFSVRVEGLEPSALSVLLETEFGILTRSGLHCAPWAHDTLGTHGSGGTPRLSFGAFTSEADVDACIEALTTIAAPTDVTVQ